jgi:hypothetical protein
MREEAGKEVVKSLEYTLIHILPGPYILANYVKKIASAIGALKRSISRLLLYEYGNPSISSFDSTLV